VVNFDTVTFSHNQARANGGALANAGLGSANLVAVTFDSNAANALADSLYLDRPTYIKIKDTTFTNFATGSDTVYLAGRQAGCAATPCAVGESCSYTEYSITCTACPANTYSDDGLACGFCAAGTGPNAAQTACEACTGTQVSTYGVCVDAPAPAPTCDVCSTTNGQGTCPTCPATPSPAPSASAGRRRQLQPVEAVQSLLPFLAPLLFVAGIVARY
jgi:predicted outer membrane repeat protein